MSKGLALLCALGTACGGAAGAGPEPLGAASREQGDALTNLDDPELESSVQRALDALSSRDEWELHPPIGAANLDGLEARLGRPLPPSLRILYEQHGVPEWHPEPGAEGGSIVVFFHDDVISDVHAQSADYLPSSYVPFADDSGPSWFYMDTEGRRGRPSGAVVRVDRGALSEDELENVADDLPGFLRWIRGGRGGAGP